MEGEVEPIEEVSGTLLPCHVCGRTFVLPSLKKHQKICEKNAAKKRKPFNSLKQRVDGTDIAQFHQQTYLKKLEPVPEVKKKKTWKEKHFELLRSIRAAKEVKDEMPVSKSSSLLADTERCPSCDRQFGPKAYDRHVEWCKEKRANERLHQSPANVVLAKERLEARIKYVPPLNRNKKTPVKEKYSSPTISTRTESTTSLVSQPSIRAKNKSSFLAKNKEKPPVKKVDRSNLEKERRNRDNSIGASTHSLLESVKSSAPIDPYTLAQMQLMELLNCDDFNRSISPKNDTNLPPVDRISTPLPIDTIKHSVESLNDEFELMESLIEDNCKIDSSINGKVCNDNISPIDPSLINENDNLSLPENFKLDDSPTSTLDSNFKAVSLQKPEPKQEKNTKPKVTNNNNTTNNSKIATKNKSNNFERGSTARASLQRKPSVESKVKNRKTLTRTVSSVSSNKSFGSEKEKSPVPHNSVKNRKKSRTPTLDEESKTIDDWFNQNNHKEEHCFKPEDLFSVDDAMYEEFKKYEELYLKERRQKSSNRRNKTKLIEINYKILAPEDQIGTNNKVSSDSAYGSLTRSTPDRSVKSLNLSFMESNLTDNHPAIDECRSSLTPSPKNQHFAKFCHECGNKYPVVTAKFCIECGVRRLIL